jgi:DtxR family transcriptional regulator, Mn-dependent transcriptional regulator
MPKLLHPDLTHSVEDYLKAIYALSEDGSPASTTRIAELLDLSAPSVSGMVKRLAEQGLLEHLPYKGVTLTADGRAVALRMVRRHRLIESYLVAFLDYTWDTVHDEAERLEHAVSDELVERMAEALGNPVADPHGDPIPAADGTVLEIRTVALPQVPVGEVVRLARVETSDAERLRWFAEAGLMPGAMLRVTAAQPFDGPVTVERDGASQVVGHAMASLLRCARGGTA